VITGLDMSKRSREDDHSSSEDGSYDGEHNEAQKYALLDNEDDLNKKAVITCSLPPHSETIPFYSYNEYEVHYKQNHYNRCFGCHKNLPTEHFLMLHIAENHDPLNQAKRGRGEKIVSTAVTVEKQRLMRYSMPALLKDVIRCA